MLDWAEPRREPHARMLRWYSACTALRRDLVPDGATRFADVAVSHDEDARWLVMTRTPVDGAAFAVVVNLADRAQDVPLGDRTPAALLLAWDEGGTQVSDHGIRMPAASAAVVSLA